MVAIFFGLLQVGVWSLYLSEENVREYCIHVPAGQPHDFQISEHNACRMDWWYFVKEPLLISFIILLVLLIPAFLVHVLAKKPPAELKKHL